MGLCFLTLLSVVSCKKNESKSKRSSTDSSVVTQPSNKDQDSVKTVWPETSDKNKKSSDSTIVKAEVSKNTIEGKFVAATCDGGRFSIELKNTEGKPTFKILDKGKIIAAGNVSAETDEKTGEITEIAMGEIGGLYEGDKIIIQNYGNAMNEFDHFTQCGDKYLEFIKSK